MNPGKFIELQHQMRINQSEMKDSFNDLDGWINDMKKKDEDIKKQVDKSSETLPPVRNSLQKKKKRKKPKHKSEVEDSAVVENKSTRISGYDFAAWDNYNVDEECERVDDKKDDSSSSDYETDEEWEELRMKQQANMLKEQGNQYFKEGKLDEAIDLYTRSIQCDPNNGILPANRAMALLKQEKYGAAELDCSAAIMLDPTYYKAYHRRGTARMALKKYSEAKSDFQRVLSFDSKNKLANSELEKLEKLMNPPKFSMSTEGDAGIVKAIYKSPSERSKQPLRRLIIEEVGDDEVTSSGPKEPMSQTKQNIMMRDDVDFDKFVQKKETTQEVSNEVPVNVISPADICGVNITEIIEQDTGSIENTESDLKLDLSGVHQSEISHNDTSDMVSGDQPSSPLLTSPQTSPRVPPAPSTSYQFQADWKVLRNAREQFFQYLRQIDPKSFSQVIRTVP